MYRGPRQVVGITHNAPNHPAPDLGPFAYRSQQYRAAPSGAFGPKRPRSCLLHVSRRPYGVAGVARCVGITRRHWVALYGLLGNTRMTPYNQKQREAGRPVWDDVALDGRFLLRRLTRTSRASEPMQQTAPWGISYAAHARLGCCSQPETGRTAHARRREMDAPGSFIAYEVHFR